MKTIAAWRDLEAYGIDALTGEACGLMYRILCDVTVQGKAIIEKCLGCQVVLPDNWNRGSDACPHIGSILLAPEMLVPLGVFTLLENGCREVWLVGHALLGIEAADNDAEVEVCRAFHEKNIRRRFAYRGTAGDRNLHVIAGRVQ